MRKEARRKSQQRTSHTTQEKGKKKGDKAVCDIYRGLFMGTNPTELERERSEQEKEKKGGMVSRRSHRVKSIFSLWERKKP